MRVRRMADVSEMYKEQIEKAKEHFEKLLVEQLERVERIPKEGRLG